MDKDSFLNAKEDYIGLFMQSETGKSNIYIEGKDDYDFYIQFFKNDNPNLIRCFSKKNVLKVASIHNRIGNYKSIFFVDRDFDDNEDIKNVFYTDFYNFESHVFSRDNVRSFLKNKHSIKNVDIENLINFLNSEAVLKMFHTEFERIKLNDGESENKLIHQRLNKFNIDSNYDFSYEELFTNNSLPLISTDALDCIEMYNGKFIGNLIFCVLMTSWFKVKFKPDMRKLDRKQLTYEMIISSTEPEYVQKAIEYLGTLN